MRSLSVVTGSEDWDWPLWPYAGMHLPGTLESFWAQHSGLVLNRRLLPSLSSSVIEWWTSSRHNGSEGSRRYRSSMEVTRAWSAYASRPNSRVLS